MVRFLFLTLCVLSHISGFLQAKQSFADHGKFTVEDGYAFMLDDKFCLQTTDNHGLIENGGGVLWKSSDGIRFAKREHGFTWWSNTLAKEN